MNDRWGHLVETSQFDHNSSFISRINTHIEIEKKSVIVLMLPTPNLYRYEFKGRAGKYNEIYHRCTPNPSISQKQSHHNPWQCSTVLHQADQTTSRRSQKGTHRSTPTHDYGQYPLLRSRHLLMGWTSAWGSYVLLLSEWTPSGPLDSQSFLRRSWRAQCLQNTTWSIRRLRLCPSMFPSRMDIQASVVGHVVVVVVVVDVSSPPLLQITPTLRSTWDKSNTVSWVGFLWGRATYVPHKDNDVLSVKLEDTLT